MANTLPPTQPGSDFFHPQAHRHQKDFPGPSPLLFHTHGSLASRYLYWRKHITNWVPARDAVTGTFKIVTDQAIPLWTMQIESMKAVSQQTPETVATIGMLHGMVWKPQLRHITPEIWNGFVVTKSQICSRQ